ncbi:MAG: tetratricopeptide repeat protein, partial [Acidobacteria bacterium]|nr:tetratricopeptide repeat protein [Acidobacteriota bacterium]
AELTSTLSIVARAFDGPSSVVAARLEVIADTIRFHGATDRDAAASALRPAVERVQGALGDWPAEDAARAAQALVRIESAVQLISREQWRPRMRQVAARFPGTRAAAVIDVDQLSSENASTPQRIQDLDHYWRTHPGTAAGAYALWQKGFQLHVNVPITGVELRGSDPTPRLLQVAAIVKELESGPYPDGEWREKAPELISGFFVSSEPSPAYTPENLDKAIGVYEDFVRARFATDSRYGLESSLTYVIETKLAALYERRGDRTGGVERFYADLERSGRNGVLAKLARGLFLARRGPQQTEARARGRAVLTELATSGGGAEARRAAAELAMSFIDAGDRVAAMSHLDAFLARWPDAVWAWMAHVRRGQLHYDAGAWPEAARSFTAAARVGAHPPAAVIGLTLAARSLEAGQRFAEARDAYQEARQRFDARFAAYGPTYRWDVLLPEGANSLKAFSSIAPEMLESRADRLSLALSRPNGARHARAAWLLEAGRLDDARANAAGDRALEREIDFEQALTFADAASSAPDDAAALRILAALRGSLEDEWMFAGQILQSAIEFRQGRRDNARQTLTAPLKDWLRLQRSRIPERQSDVDADVAAIREVLFRPRGDLSLYHEGWNAFTFPEVLSPFQIVRADLSVVLPGQAAVTRTVWQTFPDLPNTLLLESEDLARLSRILVTIGGTARRIPQGVMETPNQPIGTARDLMTFWNSSFASRPGHWGGWVLDTFPQISRITFLDAARTKALAAVTIGYSGGTVVLDKVDGRWIARRLIDLWIT